MDEHQRSDEQRRPDEQHRPMFDEQNADDFYEGPPLEEPEHWHDGAVVDRPPEQRVDHDASLEETPTPATGPYLPPDVVERPHAPTGGIEQGALTRDPSLSRAVDRAAAGRDPEAAGYDRSVEGPTPGVLEPSAEQVPADSEDRGGGQYGPSG